MLKKRQMFVSSFNEDGNDCDTCHEPRQQCRRVRDAGERSRPARPQAQVRGWPRQ